MNDERALMRVAVYGANGYQGKLVVGELLRRRMTPVLVGRDGDRLREAAVVTGAAGAEIRVAGTGNREALRAAFEGCAAVINCAGPFTLSGTSVAAAAVDAGVHYVDTAGEQAYVKAVFDEMDEAAQAARVTMLPGMNDDNVPASLLSQLISDRIGPIRTLTLAIRLTGEGSASRGSLRSALATMETLLDGGMTYVDGDWRTGVPAAVDALLFPGDATETPVVRFPLPPVITVPRHIKAERVEGLIGADVASLLSSLTSDLVDVVPEGPSADMRATDSFTVVADASAVTGERARGVVSGHDTYGITAAIAVEAARLIAQVGARPGVLAPAEALEPKPFQDYLATEFGVEWTVES